LTKKDKILKAVQNVISSYTQKLTLRQIYYRLVSKLVIKNTISQYKYLSRILEDARKDGLIPYKAIEDRTRDVNNNSEVELDALDPNVLEDLIKDTVKGDWNKDIKNSVDHLEEVLNQRFIKTYRKEILKLAERIKNGGGIY